MAVSLDVVVVVLVSLVGVELLLGGILNSSGHRGPYTPGGGPGGGIGYHSGLDGRSGNPGG